MSTSWLSPLGITFFPTLKTLITDCPYVSLFLLALGSISFAKFAIKTVGFLLQTFVLPGTNLKKYGAGKGAWAVVTGASEGIGREFALQFARKGFNVVVSARNASTLATLIAEIESSTPPGEKVQAKAITMDFSRLHDEGSWKHFEAELQGLDIGVLVNNVGKSHHYVVDFVDAPKQEVEDIIAINVGATVRVTKMVLPGMIKRKRGLIMNMGSFSGVSVASPMLATYAGTKSFIASFSASLAQEVKAKGIDVECLNTYFVVSNMAKIRRATMMVPMPKAYVRAALAKVNLPCGALWTGRPFVVTPYWSHSVLDYLMNLIGWKMFFVRYTHDLHRGIHKRVMRKLEREGKKQ
ncbi:3-ketoacyl-CoA reductase [Sparassis latifolia]|uniref:Very-long-chain 3-oxoacyl-CoA reductase n=1 Tax=Sparassis crispa TaxID=139825 RepID=A0A401GH67_9APHY|nr:Very-long-chain 3-oxoacyl-CoA reductase [Sparassis crispa]GBE81508.1 Very-long-chain 3-oxoacyl-CoA reductase [Sparassis crispa]